MGSTRPGSPGRPENGNPRALLGRRAESVVAEYLEREGYRILARNARVGRLEIDIIAQRKRLVVFCEVRGRATDTFMAPAQSIDAKKAARIRQAAAGWLRSASLGPIDVRFDAAAVVFDRPQPRIDYYEGAF